ncbi:hypothetical protein KDW36_24690 [Burkholderia dolosa]|uniref:hypothetical protein n=1 Tax=Burkholderia dolosa TaxID=152500 RepID=UPI001BA21EAC|nr:hypothetical protein [Burkholderia dolosa]MBR8316382.1 hypothetical protein [Burkholderia dolosa]
MTPRALQPMADTVVTNAWTPGIALRRFRNATQRNATRRNATRPDAQPFVALPHRAYEREPLAALAAP